MAKQKIKKIETNYRDIGIHNNIYLLEDFAILTINGKQFFHYFKDNNDTNKQL